MKWATRPECHVDRTACAWLIQRFLDPSAEFIFVDELIDVPTEATAFDMRGARLSHRDGNCSFETILSEYGLEDLALQEIGRIVHEADLDDDCYEAPEARGLDVLIRGLGLSRADPELLAATQPLFDALYEFRKHTSAAGSETNSSCRSRQRLGRRVDDGGAFAGSSASVSSSDGASTGSARGDVASLSA
jgi:hypothetical protein